MGMTITQTHIDLAEASGACESIDRIRAGMPADLLSAGDLEWASGIVAASIQDIVDLPPDALLSAEVGLYLAGRDGSGSGYGSGSGDGYGCGCGYGSGCGSGSGYGYGYGYGSGYGSGYGDDYGAIC